MTVALDAERNWALPPGQRKEIVPGASHFIAHRDRQPELAHRLSGGHDRRPHLLQGAVAEAAPCLIRSRLGTLRGPLNALPHRAAMTLSEPPQSAIVIDSMPPAEST